jgi:hypothetical protein
MKTGHSKFLEYPARFLIFAFHVSGKSFHSGLQAAALKVINGRNVIVIQGGFYNTTHVSD